MTTSEKGSSDQSIETVALKDFFAKKETKYEIEGLTVPFVELPGEFAIYIGLVSNGIIVLSNYRLFVGEEKSFFNVPISLIESIDCRDIFTLNFLCKDSRSYRCTFATNDKCLEWHRRLVDVMKIRSLTETFAFAFYAWSYDEIIQSFTPYSTLSKLSGLPDTREMNTSHWFDQEIMRLGFDLSQDAKAWRVCSANNNYKLCETYPRQHIVPFSMTDDDVAKICEFRSCNRFPSIVWRDKKTGVVLGRSSQPNTGFFWWRNTYDEAYIRSMAVAAQLNPGPETQQQYSCMGASGVPEPTEPHRNVLIIDARSYAAAMANRAKGGGYECEEYYTSSNILFMNLPNIHGVRKSYHALRQICSQSDESWLVALDGTKWMNHIGSLLRAALIVVDAICIEKKCVLIHCSDGWDRTPQISALSQILLDPFYRTLQGFHVLVEREWIDFGHKFADRCGQGVGAMDTYERCPIFIQWIDSIHQLIEQFPTAFQFNQCFLLKLAQHTYSCLFGDFLFNSDKQRSQHNMRSRTMSVWNWILSNHNFHNHLYLPTDNQRVLRPAYNIIDLHFWSALYKAPLPVTKPSTTTAPSVDTADVGIPSEISSKSSKVSTDDDDELPRHSTPTSDIASDLLGLPLTFQSNLTRFDDEDPMALQRLRHRSGAMVSMLTENESIKRSNSLDRATEYAHSIESSVTTLRSLSLETIDSIDLTKNNVILNDTKNLHPNDDYNRSESSDRLYDVEADDSPQFNSNNEITQIENCDPNNAQTNIKVVLELDTTLTHDSSGNDISGNEPTLASKQSKDEARPKDVIDTANMFSMFNEKRLQEPGAEKSRDVLNLKSDLQLNISKQKKSFWMSKEHSNSQDYSNMARNIDVDGLTCFFDPLQSRILDIRLEYERRIKQLELQVSKRQKCNCTKQQISGRVSDAKDETSSNDSGEPSSNASGSSFEFLSESQAEVTLWIPDHIATHCSGCDKEFWAALRKHHCRSCGRIFCHECTKHAMPCPSQQLNVPVRVCKHCYESAE